MPRMSKKRKQEWALFLNERNRITYNGLCRKCSSECKQSFRCVVVHCPKYLSKRRTKNYENDNTFDSLDVESKGYYITKEFLDFYEMVLKRNENNG